MYYLKAIKNAPCLRIIFTLMLLVGCQMSQASPSVSSISPSTVRVGNIITISGSGFNSTAAKNFVMFTGHAVQVPSAATSTSLTVTVPDHAQSGPIIVYSNGVASAPSSQSLLIKPEITTVSPVNVSAGVTLVITGFSFSSTLRDNQVIFTGGATATPVTATTTSLTVIVPVGATSGGVSVKTNGEISSVSSTPLIVSCTSTQAQSMLDAGSTPKEVYNSCGKTADVLYGATYGGGLIAYYDPADGSGVIAAPQDYYYASGGAYNVAVSGTQYGIGTGKQNTQLIIAAAGEPSAGHTYAAYLSKTQHYNGYTDWFLPSIDELTQIVTNLNIVYKSKTSQKPGPGCLYQQNHFVPYLVSGYHSSSVPATGKPWRGSFVFLNYECYMPKSGQPYNLVRKYPSGVRMARYFSGGSALQITGITPAEQAEGGNITITGSGFSPTALKNIVQFTGGAVAIPATATSSQVKVTIPDGAASGPVTIISNGVQSPPSAVSLTVTGS